jgi:hypothetical protein
MVSSEAEVGPIKLNKNVSCSAIGVVLYNISIHEIVIKFYMSILIHSSIIIVYVYINI